MIWNKEVNIIQMNCKVQWCRLGLILFFFIFMGITNSSCKKEEGNKDEYYVKYEVNSSTIYYGGKLSVGLNAENNQNKNITIDTRSQWENVIGPVKKGFATNLIVSDMGNNYGHLKLYDQISISKNGSSFALKQSDNSDLPRTSAQVNYTIDY